MNLDKTFFYDWNGANVDIFKAVNGIHGGGLYDTFMILLSQIADRHNFPYYMGGLLAYVLLRFVANKITGHTITKSYLAAWLGVFLVLVVGYGADGVVIGGMKKHFAYPRPYVELSSSDVRVLEHRNENDDSKSFPSGHAAFATLMVVGLFPVLTVALRLTGVFFIIGVCWSRLALGVHFPADVMAGFFISLIIVLLVRAVIYRCLGFVHLRA